MRLLSGTQKWLQIVTVLNNTCFPYNYIWIVWDSKETPLVVAQTVKCLPAMRETRVWSLGREDPLEKEMATHSSILAWKIPWMEPGRLQFMRSQRVGHDWATSLHFPSKEKWVLHRYKSGDHFLAIILASLPSLLLEILSPLGSQRHHHLPGGFLWLFFVTSDCWLNCAIFSLYSYSLGDLI